MASVTYMIGHILCYDWLCYTCINTGIVGCHATGCLYFSVLVLGKHTYVTTS